MKSLITGFTYGFRRNIGWQDRTIRAIAGITFVIGAIYFSRINFTAAAIFAIFAAAQLVTVASARCIICYFTGICTITQKEKQNLNNKGIKYEK